MKNFTKTAILILLGVMCIPAALGLAFGLGWTLLGYIWHPKGMLIACLILGILNIPGIIIGLFAKR
ncbi:MAG: hypothetical protein J6U54_17985 [Clostridiales bacterium]|nr:hypothetical protein [Clostridiales bacterium]